MASEVVQELLPRLKEFAARAFPGGREFDVALVCFAAAQAERLRRVGWHTDLTESLRPKPSDWRGMPTGESWRYSSGPG